VRCRVDDRDVSQGPWVWAGEDAEWRSHRQPPPDSAAKEAIERSPSKSAVPRLAAGAVPVLGSADRAANGLRYAYADASRRASPVTHGPDLKETQAPK